MPITMASDPSTMGDTSSGKRRKEAGATGVLVIIRSVESVNLTAGNGRALILERVSSRDVDSVWSYEATLAVPKGALRTVVYEHGRWLATDFRGAR